VDLCEDSPWSEDALYRTRLQAALASGRYSTRRPSRRAARAGVTEPDERHRALLRVLVCQEVRFVLVGGVARQLRGFSGATRDVDVTIAADDLNRRRLGAALETIRARP
jgi:hypothetical protein